MKIFVQIASYRDPQLVPTIKSMLSRAKWPGNLRVGICRQYHSGDKFDSLKEFEKDSRFRIINIPYQQSKGACWARSLIPEKYEGEEYTLQIDSHMRFAKNWDETLIKMLKKLQAKGYEKPILTGYVGSFNPEKRFREKKNEPPCRVVVDTFSPDGIIMCKPVYIPGWDKLKEPIPAKFYSAGFCFAIGQFCKEVKHDPGLYFHGEEITISARAFTRGYDFFHPHKTLLWHEYIRSNKRKHWEDDKEWYKKNEASFKRCRRLLGVGTGKPGKGFGVYGLGTVRTLKQYEKYSGISFKNGKFKNEPTPH